ncbi:MAG: hypothetical protein K0R58_16 [Ramlibacter sp.]|jgi:hypothetical protein|nr:hypothetical protein [Ramlibacter sp.]
MDVMTAAFNVAEDYKPGGARGLAAAIGENHNTFSHAVTETAGAKLGLKTALKMTKRSRDLRILLAFAAECGQMCVPLPESMDLESNDCMRALANTSKEFTELVQEVCASLSDDGNVSANELERIDREGGELVAKLQQLLATVRARHLAGLPHAGRLEG